jgi:hypothetical protein
MSATADARDAEIPLPKLSESIAPIASALDAATHDQRVAWIRGLGRGQLVRLFELAKGRGVTSDEMVGPIGEYVIHEGKNALPAFCFFQKRFARLEDGSQVGYNHNGAISTWFGGPGHFSFYDAPDGTGELWVDYIQIPEKTHPTFPALVGNDRGFGPRIVYGGMIDKLRRVSREVTIGDAYLGDKSKGVPFALVRCS